MFQLDDFVAFLIFLTWFRPNQILNFIQLIQNALLYLNIIMSQKFCNIWQCEAQFSSFGCLENNEVHWTEMQILPDTLWVLLASLEHDFRIYAFRHTWPCLIVKVLVIWVAKFLESSGYWTVFNCTFTFCTSVFGYFAVLLSSLNL